MAKERMRTRERLHALENSLHSRVKRLRKRLLSIVQISVAAGLAYLVAQELLGHDMPFFAPISVIIVVGLSGGDRVKRAFEMSLGCVAGVLVGDLLAVTLGQGWWQITVMVAIAMAVAALLSKAPLVSNQVAIGTVLIATIMPPGAETTGVDRTLDALIGSALGLLTVALIPTSALATVRQEVSNVMALAASVLSDVADGLKERDSELIREALMEVRGSQGSVDALLNAAKSSRESTQISPLMWSSRRYVRSIDRILTPVDNTVRSVRVLARRALVLTMDKEDATEEQIEIIDELSDITLDISNLYEARSELQEAEEIPDLVHRLRVLGARAEMSVAGEDAVLSAYSILAQSRSLIVDLLQVCGMSRDSAVATLAPTSDTPAIPPEVWEGD